MLTQTLFTDKTAGLQLYSSVIELSLQSDASSICDEKFCIRCEDSRALLAAPDIVIIDFDLLDNSAREKTNSYLSQRIQKELQAKLSQHIEKQDIQSFSPSLPDSADTRIFITTRYNLKNMVQEGELRDDLSYQLTVIPLYTSTIQRDPEKIPSLIEKFLSDYKQTRRRQPLDCSHGAIAALIGDPWRADMQELERLIEQILLSPIEDLIQQDVVPRKLFETILEHSVKHSTIMPTQKMDRQSGIDFNERINMLERELIIKALRQSQGNKKEAARWLNLKRTTLLEKIKKKELDEQLWKS